jgi:hypothetical protein
MKNYSPEILQALQEEKARAVLVEMYLTSGTFYLTTVNHDIEYQGLNYVSSGLLLGLDSVKQQQELRVVKLRLEFSAVDQNLLAIFLNTNQTNRKIKIMQVILNDNNQVIGVLQTNYFLIDNPSYDQGTAQSTLGVTVSNFMADFQAVRGIFTTQASFRKFYPQSTAFINAKDAGSPLKWGGK